MTKKIFFIIIMLINMTSLNAQDQNAIIQKLIDETKINYAPDKRTAIFDITFNELNGDLIFSGETNLIPAKNFFIESLKTQNFVFKDSINLLPEKNLGGKIYGLITVSVGNLRTKPDHPAELASQALLGTPVKVLKYEDGFYLVQTPDNYIAWIDDEAIERFDRKDFDEYLSSKKLMFTSEYGFSYSAVESYSPHVSDLVRGNILELVGEEKDFYKVKYPDKRFAFIKKTDAVDFNFWIESRIISKENILNEAFNMNGIPYLWGGTSYKGIDCSGFTKTVYFLNGVILSRDASQQVNLGKEIDTKDGFENLQAGDLLFFGRKADKNHKEKITHVGIYIGNLEYIHEAGKVKINSFDPNSPIFSKHRLNQFVRSKRIIDSIGENGIELIQNNQFYRGEF